MENSDEFNEYCSRAGIHLILFGHKHKEFTETRFAQSELTGDPDHRMEFFCCPSASEYASENGFYTFDFDRTGFAYILYKWDDREHVFVPGGLVNNNFVRDASFRIPYSRPLR